MLSLLAVAALVLTLSPARVFLMPSDDPHLAGLVGSLSLRLLHVPEGCSPLCVIPGLQGIGVVGIVGLLLYVVSYGIVNGISICCVCVYCLLSTNIDKMHDHLSPRPRDASPSQSRSGTRCRTGGGGSLAGERILSVVPRHMGWKCLL